jgi:hypothetical protein
LAWLSPFVTLRPELSPDPENVRQELGRESVVFEIAQSRLESLWADAREIPDVVLKRQLWAERLRIVLWNKRRRRRAFFATHVSDDRCEDDGDTRTRRRVARARGSACGQTVSGSRCS